MNNVLVSEQDAYLLTTYKWRIDKGYVRGTIDKKMWRMHRYIMIVLLNHDITPQIFVDHIDGNPLNNRRDNLRLATPAQNNMNQKKKNGATSVYYGVYKHISNKFIVYYKPLKLHASYENEEWAAWHWNLLVDRANLTFARKNDISEPVGFVEYARAEEKYAHLPIGISFRNNRFRVNIYKVDKEYQTLVEAELAVKVAKEKLVQHKAIKEQERNAEIESRPIERDENGFAVIRVTNKEGIVVDVLVDDDMYHFFLRFNILIDKGNYTRLTINRKQERLHRYIMKHHNENIENMIVDHINTNRLDNRKSNLRIVTAQQNSRNVSSHIDSTSQFVGVCLQNKKWLASIKYEKIISLGTFENEIEAAICRDQATLRYNPVYGKLNFPRHKLLAQIKSKPK